MYNIYNSICTNKHYIHVLYNHNVQNGNVSYVNMMQNMHKMVFMHSLSLIRLQNQEMLYE